MSAAQSSIHESQKHGNQMSQSSQKSSSHGGKGEAKQETKCYDIAVTFLHSSKLVDVITDSISFLPFVFSTLCISFSRSFICRLESRRKRNGKRRGSEKTSYDLARKHRWNHKTSYSTTCTSWWCEAYFRLDLRRNPKLSDGVSTWDNS